ncbi:MAG: hypothetical protein JJLCMIEE_02536 [Acidimicrobiales bacterium]|nr:MAG: aromatic ring-hydroxylating dioxygenase subunit alpha [Actinomycetota bacterium]MBV6509445.1 hypothetical protein [Acidimicrobiales bacterium]RIK06761.1 MAG: aromatic ring-hydroxylating dioxygenase subunit alpha [Acidobacteriota bacterium]
MNDVEDGTAHYSIAFPRRWWYPACPSRRLGHRPVCVTLMNTPLALFRDAAGAARAVIDRCPHRNVPLSRGRVTDDGCIECAYHGWRFDGTGRCNGVPGLSEGSGASSSTRDLPSHHTREQDGFVWIWGEQGSVPDREPLAIPTPEGSGANSGEVVFEYDLACTLHAALENALDVPHTAYLHRGIFRGGEAREITAERRDLQDAIEVEYRGEPVGLGRIRGRQNSGLVFEHWDRFFMPSTAQVEYRVPGWFHIINTILHLPLSEFSTRAWFKVRYSSRVPAALLRPIVWARGLQILRQDARMLAMQTDTIRRFGGERYTSTELDVIGNAVWRMLRQAERAEAVTPEGSRARAEETPDPGAAQRVRFRI